MSDLVRSLYAHGNLAPPTPTRPVTPLNEMVGSHNLLCIEMASLRRKSATDYLASRGIVISMSDPDNEDLLAGFIYGTARAGVILVDETDPIVRRRFSVAHELGHYVMHLSADPDEAFIEVIPAAIPSHANADEEPRSLASHEGAPTQPEESKLLDILEIEANHFASELLMPAGLVRTIALTYAAKLRGEDLVWRLATDFLVSRAAMRTRLFDLQVLSLSGDKSDSMTSHTQVPTVDH